MVDDIIETPNAKMTQRMPDASSSRYQSSIQSNALMSGPLELLRTAHPYLSWRSVVAGLFISFLCFAILMSLGMAVGGLALNRMVQTPGAQEGFPTGVAIWFIVTTLLSLFAGSYFAARIANFITARIGGAQGLVIASIFFSLFLWQIGLAVGWVGGGIARTVGAVGSSVDDVAQVMQNPQVSGLLDRLTGDLNLRSEPDVVVEGVIVRLVRGNENGAINYFARQANIPTEQARQRIGAVREDLQAAIQSTAVGATNMMTGAGWALFATMVIGAIAATMGGALGSRENLRHPISAEARDLIDERSIAGAAAGV